MNTTDLKAQGGGVPSWKREGSATKSSEDAVSHMPLFQTEVSMKLHRIHNVCDKAR
jgi:hypothetical protein